MKNEPSSRFSSSRHEARTNGDGAVASLVSFFKRNVATDVVVRGDEWLKESGVQQQLEFEGYQLRWVAMNRVDVNLADGWQYVRVSHHLWWRKRVRRRHGPQTQYLLKKPRSFRALGA